MRLFGLVAFALTLLFVPPARAATGGANTMTFWNSLPPEDQSPFLAGAMEMLGGIGLQCPGKITLKDVKDVLRARLQTGKSSTDDRFAWEVLSAHYALGCTLDRHMVDTFDPALRKRLPATPK